MPIRKPLAMKHPQVGQLIRELRQEFGLTQEQFAAEVGVVYNTVNKWENHHQQPSSLALKLIEGMLREMEERGQDLRRAPFWGVGRLPVDIVRAKHLKGKHTWILQGYNKHLNL